MGLNVGQSSVKEACRSSPDALVSVSLCASSPGGQFVWTSVPSACAAIWILDFHSNAHGLFILYLFGAQACVSVCEFNRLQWLEKKPCIKMSHLCCRNVEDLLGLFFLLLWTRPACSWALQPPRAGLGLAIRNVLNPKALCRCFPVRESSAVCLGLLIFLVFFYDINAYKTVKIYCDWIKGEF